jgi:DNA gyrase subunit A
MADQEIKLQQEETNGNGNGDNGNGDIAVKSQKTDYGTIISTGIVKEMETAYLDYAMSVIVARALPDVRDGLKPVHRRILYACKVMGLTHKSAYKKSARIVGEVLGKFHPHGDQAVYQTLVRLAQNFSMRYPLIDGQGNFGSVDGDSAAAMRYTEARLSKISQHLLEDIDKNTVNFTDNFDGSEQEPEVLPAKLPNLLLMGGDGIAVGMATKIPTHNLLEVIGAVNSFIDQSKVENIKVPADEIIETVDPKTLAGDLISSIEIDDMLKNIKGPDFPTGGIIYDQEEIRKLYHTGKASIVNRGVAEIAEDKKGRFSILITEIPYQVNKARLITQIADLVKKKKIEGISDLRDESDQKGMTVVVELKRDAKPKSVLNKLYKFTQLQVSYPANMVALTSDGTPHLLNLKQIIREYICHRQIVVVRRSQFELISAKQRAHILEGLLKALDHIDEVIETIKKSKDSDDARTNLMKKFDLSEIQSNAILEMQLRRLAALERKKIEDEYNELLQKIKELILILKNPERVLSSIKVELNELAETYKEPRRTKVIKAKIGEFREEDLIASEETIVTLTQSGYIKRMDKATFKSQRRGGKGVSGMTVKDSDEIRLITRANTHDKLLIFTSKGKVFSVKVFELPEGSRTSKGQAIINLINIDADEQIQSLLPLKEGSDDSYLFFTTKKGIVKKTSLSEYKNIKSNGLIAINLTKGDELVWVKITKSDYHIMLITKHGKSIRFEEKAVRPTKRDTMGVKGINIKGDDYIVTMESFSKEQKQPTDKRLKHFRDLLIVTEKGLGKRTSLSEYPIQNRGGQGLKVANLTTKTGLLAGARIVTQRADQLIISTSKAQAIKLKIKNIPQLKRPTQGVILMRLGKTNDQVTTITTLDKTIKNN